MAKPLSQSPPAQTLRELLRHALRLREEGSDSARFMRAMGAVDGYMQALIDAGLAEERELLHLVAEERAREAGPGSGECLSEPPDVRAVA